MKSIKASQEEIDRLSAFIQKHVNNEPNPFTQEKVKDVFNRLPDSSDSKMRKEDRDEL